MTHVDRLENVPLSDDQRADLDFFKTKLARALKGNPAGVDKIQAQHDLLEDALVVYHLQSPTRESD